MEAQKVWGVSINYSHPETPTRIAGYATTRHAEEDGKIVPGLIASLAEAKRTLIYWVNYYTAMGYQITELIIDETCAECDGRGKIINIGKRGGRTSKICPSCRGKESKVVWL